MRSIPHRPSTAKTTFSNTSRSRAATSTRAFDAADVIVEGEYRVPHQEQAYIENNGVIAWVEDDGTVVVMGSMQCPYYVHKALKAIFAVPDDRVRVIQTTTGGGFGGRRNTRTCLPATLRCWRGRRAARCG